MHWMTKLASTAIALAGAAGLSCAGPDESPTWSLTKAFYDPYGNAALLSPANDSRVNLLLLLGDRSGASAVPDTLAGRTFFSWYDLVEATDPAGSDQAAADSFSDPSRCQSMAGGERDFLAALAASKASAADKAAVRAQRLLLTGACANSPEVPATAVASSAAGKAFARYVDGAGAFYAGRFEEAATAFAGLAKAPDPWVAEASRYMAARTALNAAQATAFDEYGSLLEPERRDRATLARARQGFEDYLKAYPAGAYAASARGLLRRVAWLAGDDARLGAAYALATSARLSPEAALTLAEEIDYKLPPAQNAAAGPLLLAVSDLQRMRTAVQYDYEDKPAVMPASELAAQAGAFKGAEPLYDYVRAAHAFYVAKTPAAVLKLLPDAARAPNKSALDFSRQMLRGLALDAVGDRNARGFWLESLGAATGPGQHHAVELALARHDEVTGGLGRVFAAGSPVTDPVARAILLQRAAPPALLRQQATKGSEHERAVALSILLAKELTRGFYADFLRDLALVPREARSDSSYFAEADGFVAPDDFLNIQQPTAMFTTGPLGDYGCPALRQTVATLEKSPLAPTARLCLGEFLRANGFDYFPFDQPLEQGLGSSKPLFPGSPLVRQAIYRQVMDDPMASAEDRAYALYRAVNCYAPSGNNDCGGDAVDVAVRKGWFQRLKREYPKSRWATELKYYW